MPQPTRSMSAAWHQKPGCHVACPNTKQLPTNFHWKLAAKWWQQVSIFSGGHKSRNHMYNAWNMQPPAVQGAAGGAVAAADPSLWSNQTRFKLCPTSHDPVAASRQVRVHERTHTGEKPYKCAHCDFRTAQGGNLRTHQRRHLGVKRYPCPYVAAS